MLINTPFYHGIIRKAIVSFGNLFSNIKIQRKSGGSVSGNLEQTIAVPIAYSCKEKWLVRVDQDPTLDNHTYTLLPRIAFEITGMTYDSARKLNRMNQIKCYDTGTLKRTYVPVPYNIDISMYILTKTQEDALQIVEQILPRFAPEYNLSVEVVSETQTVLDIPIILNSVNVQDDYDGDFQTRRFVTYTLNFTMKASIFGPVNNQGIIDTVITNITNDAGDVYANYTVEGNPLIAWAASTAVAVGQRIFHATNLYNVTVAGTTHASTPPTHTTGLVVNGTASLTYAQKVATATNIISEDWTEGF